MISDQILRFSPALTRLCYQRVRPKHCLKFQCLPRFGSTLSKQSSSKPNQSTGKSSTGKSDSEYLARDMYDYTTFSYYDIEASMTKFRLPQPSAYAPLKPPEPAKK